MADSYTFPTSEGAHRIQLITGLKTSTPEQIINSFDFVNCAFALTAADEAIYLHKDFIAYHSAQELQILNPWMLDKIESNNTLLLTQLLRFEKYCKRWNYTLSKDSLEKLISIYNLNPHMHIKAKQKYQVGSAAQTFVTRQGSNVWHVLADTIKNSSYWRPEMDQHGVLTSKLIPRHTYPKNEWTPNWINYV
jgi:hypothetical protein